MNKINNISFDMFDTLVSRSLNHPHDVFTLIEATGVVKFRFFLNIFFSFKTLRIFSEKLCRFVNKRNKEDVNLFDIYRVLSFLIKEPSRVLKKEIEVELIVSIPLINNIKKFNKLRSNIENEVFVTSDMYLPRKILKKILDKHEIKTNTIYVSSEIGLTKSTGNLFKYIAKERNIKFGEIYHYGDNLISDIAIPASLGIKSIHVGNAQQIESNRFWDIFKPPVSSDYYYRIGYEFCGKLAFIFSSYINENIKEKNYNIIFGARDSYLFKFAFDLFYNSSFQYRTYYTRISRNLVYIPEAYYLKSYDRLFHENIRCDEFFQRLNLVCPNQFKGKSTWDNKLNIEEYLINNIEFQNTSSIISKDVTEYLSRNGFNKDVYFIDLGWKGSIQDSLKSIFKDIDIQGLYLGTVVHSRKKKGLLFTNKYRYTNFFNVMQSVAFFEFLFTEPERSLKSVKKEDNIFRYIFADDESNIQIDLRKRIHEGAERFLLDFFELNKQLNFENKFLKKYINELVYNHTMDLSGDFIKEFLNLTHSSGFNASLKSNIVEFSEFSILGYLTSPWKAYFMRELRKVSILKYCIYKVLFHNFLFFTFYDYLKVVYRKIRKVK